MKIALVRHGETIWNSLKKVQGQMDIPLNDDGISQARILATDLLSRKQEFHAIYSSTLQRAKQTAEIINESLHLPFFLDARLNSRHIGDFAGKTLEEINSENPILYQMWKDNDPNFCPPHGESNTQMISRIKDFIEEIKPRYTVNEKILIITHRECIGAFMRLIIGTLIIEDPLNQIKNCTTYELDLL